MNINKIREDFPVLQKKLGGKPIIYFDNACMSLKPRQVVEKIDEYYNEYPACAERSHHKLGKRATEEYEQVRGTVKKFLNAKSEHEIIFTRNTTEAINLVAKSYDFKKDTVIIQTGKEHNSNLIPWQMLIKDKGFNHEIIPAGPDDGFDLKKFEQILSRVRMQGKNPFVAMVYTSNMDGSSIPVKEIIKLSHDYHAKVLLDCAQAVAHKKVDVRKLDADFIAFSGHKMLGPTGTGVLYGKEEMISGLKPFLTGGSTVKDSTYETVEFEEAPNMFEAGLQDYAGIIGFGEAIKYLSKYIDDIGAHEQKLNTKATNLLNEQINILGPQDPKQRSGIVSFNAKNGMDHHEVALLLDSFANVMVRSGRHCVHSWFNANNIEGSARASMYLYNTEEEVQVFADKLKEILKMKK